MLLVDDEVVVRNLVQYILLRAGFDVLMAADASEALELFRRCKGEIDLLLTDVNMPGMSGPELACAVARERPEARILLMTGRSFAEEIPARFRSDILHKPFTPRLLLQRIASVLKTSCHHEIPALYDSMSLG